MGLSLTKTRLRAGIWEGVLQGVPPDAVPQIRVTHQQAQVDGVTLAPAKDAGGWTVRVPIPPDSLSDGVQTFLFHDAATGDKLGHFTIVTGEALDDDIRAEIDLLRAELDMLKRAFRRHCLETAS